MKTSLTFASLVVCSLAAAPVLTDSAFAGGSQPTKPTTPGGAAPGGTEPGKPSGKPGKEPTKEPKVA